MVGSKIFCEYFCRLAVVFNLGQHIKKLIYDDYFKQTIMFVYDHTKKIMFQFEFSSLPVVVCADCSDWTDPNLTLIKYELMYSSHCMNAKQQIFCKKCNKYGVFLMIKEH